MSGETEKDVSGWTTDTLRVHLLALRAADKELQLERDRRYTEVNIEKEKALKIKEQGDRDALQLAREIQTYKDEKANELREQINRERVLYATKDDVAAAVGKIEATIGPVVSYVSSQQGRSSGLDAGWKILIAAVGLIGALITIFFALRR